VERRDEPRDHREWAVDVFKAARRGLKTAFVVERNARPKVLRLHPAVDRLLQIDLKAMDDKRYRERAACSARRRRHYRMVHERLWLEIVTLIVPGVQRRRTPVDRAGRADRVGVIAGDFRGHVTAFHKDYKMTDPENTPVATLLRRLRRSVRGGAAVRVRGKSPGRVGRWEHTYCPDCGDLLIERYGYVIKQQRVGPGGRCPSCSRRIPGIWS